MLKIKKFNIHKILLSNPQSIFKFPNNVLKNRSFPPGPNPRLSFAFHCCVSLVSFLQLLSSLFPYFDYLDTF